MQGKIFSRFENVFSAENQWINTRNTHYYINTNEIPGELSRENMISSHVKFTCENITVAMAT